MAKTQKTILTPHQKKVLETLAQERYFTDRYYLAGGTALAEFHLKHRLSEDLDLFTELQEVQPIPITRFFQKHAKQLKIKKIDTKTFLGLYTLFISFEDSEVLKVDFNYYPFPRIEKGMKFKNLSIEGIYDIGVDKVHTICLKPRARDYIDVFFIIKKKGYDFKDLILQAKSKFDWDITAMELGGRFLEAAKMTDYPRMLKKIDHREWIKFFEDEAKKLRKEIFE